MEEAFPQNETKNPAAEERFVIDECLQTAYECCDPRSIGEYRQRDPKRAAKAHEDFEHEYRSWSDYTFAKYLFLLVLYTKSITLSDIVPFLLIFQPHQTPKRVLILYAE